MTTPYTPLPDDLLNRFSTAMSALPRLPHVDLARDPVALAVSGGADSMALLALFAAWRMRTVSGGDDNITVLTVDHGLRAAAAAEAAMVADVCRALGIRHQILNWRHDGIDSGIQAAARRARYDLMQDYMREHGIGVLLTAHHIDDQAETFWMRLAHGSGLQGLCGMKPAAVLSTVAGDTTADVYLLRPFLGFTRDALREICAAHRIPFADDPSNEDTRYLRPRLRGFADVLAAEGLTPQRLAAVMQKLADADAALDTVVKAAMPTHAGYDPAAGFFFVNHTYFTSQPVEIRRRLVALALNRVAPADYPAGAPAVDQLLNNLSHDAFSGQTLGGADIFLASAASLGKAGDAAEYICICREAAAMPPAVSVSRQNPAIWDQRFIAHVDMPDKSDALSFGALGETGRLWLKGRHTDLSHPYPVKIMRGLPAVFAGTDVVAVPALGFYAPPFTPAHIRIAACGVAQ